jgi:hypothetical protein
MCTRCLLVLCALAVAILGLSPALALADEPPDTGLDPDGGVDETGDEDAGVTAEDEALPEEAGATNEEDPFADAAEWDDFGEPEETEEKTERAFRIHGKFEDQLTGMWLRRYGGGAYVTADNYTRLRVDLDADLPGGLALRSDAVAKIYAGETTLHMKDLLPDDTLDQLIARDPRWASALEETYTYDNDYYIDNVYLKVPIKSLVLFVGKQPLEQGVGYVWNPTDVFTQKDLFDPTYEKPGVIALRGILAIGQIASIDLVGVPNGDFSEWTGGGRASVRAGPLSLSASSYVTRVRRTDLEGSMDAMAAAVLAGTDPEKAALTTRARRVLVGGDAVLDIEGVRLWTEGAYNFVEDKDGAPNDWFEIVGGAEYFFRTETHVMAEVLHYGRGPMQRSGVYAFNDWMGVLSSDLKMLGKDFLFESIDQPVFDFWTLGLSSFQSVSDASAAIMGDVRWQFTEDAELWLLLSYAVGEKNDFLSSGIAQGWLRLTAYF